MFGGWGRLVHRHRGLVLLLSTLLLAGSGLLVAMGGTLSTYDTPEGTESDRGARLMDDQVPAASGATFLVVLSHPRLTWDESAFKWYVLGALDALGDDPRVRSIQTPYDLPPEAATAMVSRDGHRVMAIVALHDDIVTASDSFPELRAKIVSDTLDVKTTDRVAIYSDINTILAEDLTRSEAVSLPLVLLLLLVVFGSVVAAILPLGVGMLAVVGGLGGVYLATRVMDVSVYAVNIVTLIGLGVAIDYSLFIVTRFREETASGRGTEDALASTMATAGRAVAFSGLTVAIGLAGLMFFRGLYFSTIGLAGAIVVTLAVVYALTFLPAILSWLGPRIDKLRVPTLSRRPRRSFWGPLARGVMRRPVAALAPTLAVLLVAGLPFFALQMGGAGVEQLPPHAESREGYQLLQDEFEGAGANTISVVVEWSSGAPLSREHVGALHDLSRRIAQLESVDGVTSIVDLDPRTSKAEYQAMYQQPKSRLPPPVQSLMNQTVGSTIAVLRVQTPHEESSLEARALVDELREAAAPAGARILVTGPTAIVHDTIHLVYLYAPGALAFVVVTTYVLLLLQTGSVVLPLKAILMNVLSIAASFGAMVWIFQQGHLSDLLGFTPAPLDPSLPVLLFCIVFGLSMDYEVLLLSRMHEEYERTRDNTQAVAAGLEKSGRLITSAAAIMILVFGAFALAQVTLVKAIGLGLALAIAVDATLVRALVVPAAMRLMGDWNWWGPKALHRLWKVLG